MHFEKLSETVSQTDRIDHALNGLVAWLKQNKPKALKQMGPQVPDDYMLECAEKLGMEIPEFVRAIYRRYNGTDFTLIDGADLYNFDEAFMEYLDMLDMYNDRDQTVDTGKAADKLDDIFKGLGLTPETMEKVKGEMGTNFLEEVEKQSRQAFEWWHPGLLVFAFSEGEAYYLVDIDQQSESYGQVFWKTFDEDVEEEAHKGLVKLAPSLDIWLEDHVMKIYSGEVFWSDDQNGFVTHKYHELYAIDEDYKEMVEPKYASQTTEPSSPQEDSARINAAWDKLEAWLKANQPEMFEDLNSGASDADIVAAEQAMGVSFPKSFKAFYRRHNGNSEYIINGGQILPLKDMVATWKMHRQVSSETTVFEKMANFIFKDEDEKELPPGRAAVDQPKYIPFTDMDGNGYHLILDPSKTKEYGRLINCDIEMDAEAAQDYFVDWFEGFVNGIESGDTEWDEDSFFEKGYFGDDD